MMGDYHVRFCERLGVKFPLPTRLGRKTTRYTTVIIKKQVETSHHIKNGAKLKSHMSRNIKIKNKEGLVPNAFGIGLLLVQLKYGLCVVGLFSKWFVFMLTFSF